MQVAAKIRADRIHASVSLPFHRVPSVGEQQTEMVSVQEMSTSTSAEPRSELANSSPSQPISPSKTKSATFQEAAPYEELGDYVMVGNMENDSRRRSVNDVATKNHSNWSKQFATEEEVPLPKTLSEMRRQPKHEGREHQHPGDSSARKPKRSTLTSEIVNDGKQAEMSNQRQHGKWKSDSPADVNRSDVEANEESVAGEAAFQTFDYDAARREIGLGENLVSRKEDSETGRGRGRGRAVNPNKRQKQLPPPSTNGSVQPFDPLRRARQEPRPEGIPAAKRRQVFPQTGNRTAYFRR
jgi:hypothetical protein